MGEGEFDDDEYDWDEPCGECENCGGNLYREDEELCDQCAWWVEEANREE